MRMDVQDYGGAGHRPSSAALFSLVRAGHEVAAARVSMVEIDTRGAGQLHRLVCLYATFKVTDGRLMQYMLTCAGGSRMWSIDAQTGSDIPCR